MASIFYDLKGKFKNLFNSGNDKHIRDLNSSTPVKFDPGTPEWDEIEGNELDIYETTGVLKMIINRKAGLKAAGIWKHVKINSDGTEEQVVNSKVLPLLKNPNVLTSGQQFIKELEINRCVFGANYMYGLKGFSSQEVPTAMWNILPQLMSVEVSGKYFMQTKLEEIISKFVYDRNGKAHAELTPDEVLYLRMHNASHPVFRSSPLNALQMEISNIRAAMGFRNVVMRKKGAIGAVSPETKDDAGVRQLTAEERQEMHKAYQDNYGMQSHQMQINVSPFPIKWQPFTFPLKDYLLFEEVDNDARVIMDHFGLNEHLFSMSKNSALGDGGGKILEGQKMALQSAIIPESDNDSAAITRFLKLDQKNERVYLDYSHVPALQENSKENAETAKLRADTYNIYIQSGFSRQEAMELSGHEI